jgi:hypothetical protein
MEAQRAVGCFGDRLVDLVECDAAQTVLHGTVAVFESVSHGRFLTGNDMARRRFLKPFRGISASGS